MLLSSTRAFQKAATLLLSLLLSSCMALNPVVVKGYKFFDSVTGAEIVLKGIDYYPRPNSGWLNQNGMDFFTEDYRSIWERDLEYLQELGVNAIRLYSVDPYANHDAFMCAMDRAGIYVVVELASGQCPTCAITRDQAPNCYPPHLKQRGQQVIEQFSQYSNTIAFSTGNEVNHFAPDGEPEWNGPCQKKFLRDSREYVAGCAPRHIPVGLVAADSQRDENALYYNCDSTGDEYENAEWYGLNSYVYCNGHEDDYKNAMGFIALQEDFKRYNYSIPVVLTEYGCLSRSFETEEGYEGQRNFLQAKWLGTEPDLLHQFSGGFVFEYSTEFQNAIGDSPYPFRKFGLQNYGVGYLEPENCDELSIPCNYVPLPNFYHLKKAFQQNATNGTLTTLAEFEVDRVGRTECPSQFPALDTFEWKADHQHNKQCRRKFSNFTCPANLDELRGRYRYGESKSHFGFSKAVWIFGVAVFISMSLAGCYLWREPCDVTDDCYEEAVRLASSKQNLKGYASSDETVLLSVEDFSKAATSYESLSVSPSFESNDTEDAYQHDSSK